MTSWSWGVFRFILKTDVINPWQWSKQQLRVFWSFWERSGTVAWSCTRRLWLLIHWLLTIISNSLQIGSNICSLQSTREWNLCCIRTESAIAEPLGGLSRANMLNARHVLLLLFQSDCQEHLRMLQPRLTYQGRHCQTSTMILQYFFSTYMLLYFIVTSSW